MMSWTDKYLPEAEEDLKELDGSVRIIVLKAITKVSKNPLPKTEGGYGNPLSNSSIAKLAGLLKIKIKRHGIRIVYNLVRKDNEMLIVIIGARTDFEVYKVAYERFLKH